MDKRKKNTIEGRHYASGKPIVVEVNNGIIERIVDHVNIPETNAYAKMPVIAPGLVDLQVNGFMGVDFNDPLVTADQLDGVAQELVKLGVTTFFPTLITAPHDRISESVKKITEIKKLGGIASEAAGGIHIEGPFISPEDGPRGAHPQNYCINPDIDLVKRWQEAAEGNVTMLTLAPELPGSVTLIKACVKMNIIVAIGHTAASGDDIKRAADAGAVISTHLGNGTHAVLPRHPNCIWEQLAEDRLYASMIADGIHLPESVLKVFSRIKKGKAILISDAMSQAGMPPGKYVSNTTGRVRLTEEGRLHVEGDPAQLAGSASNLLQGVRRMSGITGFVRAWEMGSVYPLNLLCSDAPHGLQEGAPADLVLLEPGLESSPEEMPGKGEILIRKVFKNGKTMF